MEISEEIVMVPGDEFESLSIPEKFVWSQEMVKLLIDEYKKVQHEFSHSNVKKKNVWRKISQSFVDKGYPHITEDMCDKKWRNLKKTFKEIYVGLRGTNSKTKWPYYSDVEDIFVKDPNIMSAVTLPGQKQPYGKYRKIRGPDGQAMRVELMEVIGNLDDEYLEENETAAEGGDESQLWTTYETMPSQEPPTWFSEFLQQYRADEERRTEFLTKMHNDIMAVEEKKCALLAALLDKLGGAQGDSIQETSDYYLQLEKETDGETVSEH